MNYPFILRLLIGFIISLSAYSVHSAHSQALANSAAQINYAPLIATKTATVTHIINPLTIQLDDASLVRLGGLNLPDYKTEQSGQYAQMTSAILRDMLVGEQITLYQHPKPNMRKNRMDHDIAHIQRTRDKIWVQGTLLRLGLARMRTRKSLPYLAADMRKREDLARIKKKGLWQESTYKIRAPSDVDQDIGSFQIVQGLVLSTAMNNGIAYINFGKNWREDFTISIPKAEIIPFAKAGIDPLKWRGKIVQVRGWVDSYNGPIIKLNHPEAIIVIEGLDGMAEELAKFYKKKKKKTKAESKQAQTHKDSAQKTDDTDNANANDQDQNQKKESDLDEPNTEPN